jgi:hypothetical protein
MLAVNRSYDDSIIYVVVYMARSLASLRMTRRREEVDPCGAQDDISRKSR